MLERNGLKYSSKQFEGYKTRCKVEVITLTGSEHNIDVYTDDTNRDDIRAVLDSVKTKIVYSTEIVHWSTKEQDDADSKFVDDVLKEI